MSIVLILFGLVMLSANNSPCDTPKDACGPLVFGKFYDAYPDGTDDWYFVDLKKNTH